MNEQFKKIFIVPFALLLGIGIILFAWKGVSTNKIDDQTKNALQVVSPGPSPKTLGARNIYGNALGSAPLENSATTTTDALARNLLVDYAIAQKGMTTTAWSDADAEALAENLIEKIELPKAIQYTTKDLNISSDNSDTALVVYGESVLKIMAPLSSPKRVGESTIFGSALIANDATKLQGLTAIIAEYAQIKNSLLALKTPSAVAPLHLRFIQNFANIEVSITSMQKIFSDPAQGLAGFIEYKKEIAALSATGKEFQITSPSANRETLP